MLVLGIESSCDETAAAVVRLTAPEPSGQAGQHAEPLGQVLSDVVHSQVAVHAPYGGVVPELASRDHMRNVRPVVEAALAQAGQRLEQIDGIAVTSQPGLSGALLVGVQLAQGLAWALDKPLVGVDHLVGHLLASFLVYPDLPRPDPAPAYPFIALLASGGHSALYKVLGPGLSQIEELGATRDDAAGEAFDKVAKLLGLGYPGGPVIDRLAAEGDASAVLLSKPMPRKDSLEFSFSGLKSNVVRWVETHGHPGNDRTLRNLCAAFQSRVVDSLVSKSLHAARTHGIARIVLGGGVAANRQLRTQLIEHCARYGIEAVIPPSRSCTDNAAMIAYAGALRLRAGEDDRGQLQMSPRSLLQGLTRKGRGKRADEPAATSRSRGS
ncbi:MAG: hypothetical protein RJA70_1047 [Pseudomonadota bacterium]|jgi:N6-L-threonylcarbamoyladenine synthase